MRSSLRFLLFMVALFFFLEACHKPKTTSPRPARPSRKTLPPRDSAGAQPKPAAVRMGWAIQAGAFSQIDNAVRLSNALSNQGLEATYFRDSDKLYKVRFGDFPNKEAARRRADTLRTQGVLEVYYLVAPESLPASRIGTPGAATGIRKSLVSTAESYIGIPYLWGGTSPEKGFDCSGLTQSVYRLNGLSIPRTSREQFARGTAVSKGQLKGGDLLFFATAGGSTVNHVAIYVENGVFIHAPKPGTTIRKDNLNNPVLSKQYVGARSYL